VPGGGGVPRRWRPAGGAAGLARGLGGRAAPGRATAACDTAQGGPAACARRQQGSRGGALAPAVRISGGKKHGEEEESVGKLTMHLIWAGDGRRWEIDERGGAPAELQWRPAMATRF